jgi:hypothetical protein
MSNSGTGYLLGSFSSNSAPASGHQDDNGWGSYGVQARVVFEGGLYDSFRQGAIKPSSFVPIMS